MALTFTHGGHVTQNLRVVPFYRPSAWDRLGTGEAWRWGGLEAEPDIYLDGRFKPEQDLIVEASVRRLVRAHVPTPLNNQKGYLLRVGQIIRAGPHEEEWLIVEAEDPFAPKPHQPLTKAERKREASDTALKVHRKSQRKQKPQPPRGGRGARGKSWCLPQRNLGRRR